MTLFIAFALLWHMDASFWWYLLGFIIWLAHCNAHKI